MLEEKELIFLFDTQRCAGLGACDPQWRDAEVDDLDLAGVGDADHHYFARGVA